MAPSYMTDIISLSKNDNYSLRSVKHNDLVLKKKPKHNFSRIHSVITVLQYGIRYIVI